jgi:hypothetical protein
MVLLAIVIPGLLVLYVGSYVYLSGRGKAELKQTPTTGFFYVPLDDIDQGSVGLRRHYQRCSFFAPLNWVDRECFGGCGPVSGITWGLSGEISSVERKPKRDEE